MVFCYNEIYPKLRRQAARGRTVAAICKKFRKYLYFFTDIFFPSYEKDDTIKIVKSGYHIRKIHFGRCLWHLLNFKR